MTDPRVLRTVELVHRAALDVLRRDGLAGATMEAIASEAGVARSTLYRNWESRDALLAEAIDGLAGPAGGPARLPSDESAIDRLERVLVDLASSLRHSEWGATLPAIVAAAHGDPTTAERYHGFTEARRAEVLVLIREALASGEVTSSARPDDLLDALAGPLFYRHLVRGRSTSPAWVRAHLRRTLHLED